MQFRCAVLDDFQNVASACADWSTLTDRVEVVSFAEHFATEDELAAALADFDFVVTLRERVPFPDSLLNRLPRLKLLIASGMRNSVIDYAAAKAGGVTVCGTQSSSTPPVELAWALLLGLARGIVQENNALRDGGPWQSTVGADLRRRTLGLLGLGKIGSRVAQVGLAFGMEVTAWSRHLTKERADEVGVGTSPPPRRSCWQAATSSPSPRARGPTPGPARRRRDRPPQAHRLPDQHLAGRDRRPGGPARRAARGPYRPGAGVDVFEVEPLPGQPPDAHRTAAARHPASRLCVPRQLRALLRPGPGGHPGLPRRRPGPGPRLTCRREPRRQRWDGAAACSGEAAPAERPT